MTCNYFLFIFVVFQGLCEVHGVPEPCLRSVIKDSTIGNMCNSSIGEEATKDGHIRNDSVFLRIVIPQENCKCYLTIIDQVKDEILVLRKHDGSPNAAPTNAHCGLAADITSDPDGHVISTIECTKPNNPVKLRLMKGQTLTLKSKLIPGDFKNGYCMQFSRYHKYSITDNQSLIITCDDPIPIKHTTAKESTTARVTTQRKSIIKEKDVTLYIIIGIGVAVVVLAVFIVIVVRHVRNESRHDKRDNKSDMKSGELKQDNNDNGVDGLQDNILYKSFDNATNQESQGQTELTNTFGDYSQIDNIKPTPKQKMTKTTHKATDHYNTIEVDSSRPNNKPIVIEDNYSTISEAGPKISDNKQPKQESEITKDNYSTIELHSEHANDTAARVVDNASDVGVNKTGNTFNVATISADNQDTANNVYAVVNKTDKTSSTKGYKDNTSQPEQTYAVVDKSWKKSDK